MSGPSPPSAPPSPLFGSGVPGPPLLLEGCVSAVGWVVIVLGDPSVPPWLEVVMPPEVGIPPLEGDMLEGG